MAAVSKCDTCVMCETLLQHVAPAYREGEVECTTCGKLWRFIDGDWRVINEPVPTV